MSPPSDPMQRALEDALVKALYLFNKRMPGLTLQQTMNGLYNVYHRVGEKVVDQLEYAKDPKRFVPKRKAKKED